MITAIIIEDELLAQKKLLTILRQAAPEIYVKAVLGSVKEGIEFFKRLPLVDIIFCDVQLQDGLSFAIFTETQIRTPVILPPVMINLWCRHLIITV